MFKNNRSYVIPSVLLLFLPYYCHSFRIIVIPSVLVSFLLYYCHSFHIIVIPSELLSFQLFVILNSSCTLPYLKGEKICHICKYILCKLCYGSYAFRGCPIIFNENDWLMRLHRKICNLKMPFSEPPSLYHILLTSLINLIY
jgi:hypothetical protein